MFSDDDVVVQAVVSGVSGLILALALVAVRWWW
jgi:hypothetical protein